MAHDDDRGQEYETPPPAETGREPLHNGNLFQDAAREFFGPPQHFGEIIGDPAAGLEYFEGRQVLPNSCAENAAAYLIDSVTGLPVHPDQLVDEAAAMHIYTPEHGTQFDRLAELIEREGVPVTYKPEGTAGQLIYEIREDHPVILGVNAAPGEQHNPPDLSRGVLWEQHWTPDQAVGFRGIDAMDHAILVKGIDMSTDPPQVLYTDSGTGDILAREPLTQIIDACDGSGCPMIVSDVPAHSDRLSIEIPAPPQEAPFGYGYESGGPIHDIPWGGDHPGDHVEAAPAGMTDPTASSWAVPAAVPYNDGAEVHGVPAQSWPDATSYEGYAQATTTWGSSDQANTYESTQGSPSSWGSSWGDHAADSGSGSSSWGSSSWGGSDHGQDWGGSSHDSWSGGSSTSDHGATSSDYGGGSHDTGGGSFGSASGGFSSE